MLSRRNIRISKLAILLAAAACGESSHARDLGGTPDTAASPRPPVTAVVDSAMPIEEALRRFRADLPDQPTRLSGGASTRDELVQRFIRAVEQHDTASIREMVLSRAEFAYLYYPESIYTGPPTEIEPGLLWFLTTQNSEKGIVRVLRRLGGLDLGYTGHSCEAEPKSQAQNRFWESCHLELTSPPVDFPARRLFGSIMERDGHFKFVSYANDL